MAADSKLSQGKKRKTEVKDEHHQPKRAKDVNCEQNGSDGANDGEVSFLFLSYFITSISNVSNVFFNDFFLIFDHDL